MSSERLEGVNKQRTVICGDAVDWLLSSDDAFEGSVFTAVPDVKDVPQFNSLSDVRKRGELYTEWFNAIAEAIFRRLPDGQAAIFSQTDAKVLDLDGRMLCWIDKSHLCAKAAEKYGCKMLWHKIALNNGTIEEGQYRPSFTHLVCFGKQFEFHIASFRTPDVLDRGIMTWQKATGLDSCILGISFLLRIVKTTVVLSPFCGRGTILATANYFGLPAIGIEICSKRARSSRAKSLDDVIDGMSPAHLQNLGALPMPDDSNENNNTAKDQGNCHHAKNDKDDRSEEDDGVEFSFSCMAHNVT
jgi:hypothetical protein